LSKVELNKVEKLTAKNFYWQKNGFMVMDPDGYRIVISPQKIEK